MDKSVAGFFEKSFGKLKNYLRSSYAGLSEYDAEDIIQQTALNMLSRSGSIGDVEHAASYIYTALRNGAKNFFRKRGRELVSDEIDAGSTVTTEDEILAQELKERLRDALMMLDEKSRFVFVETELKGRSYKELSERTGEPVGTLLSRKSRAAKKMMIFLDGYIND